MHFPLFLELDGRPCLVVGAGPVAVRKAKALEDFGARVKAVAPEVCGRAFEDADVEGMTLVVSATNDRAVNRRVAELCKARGIPVNVVDDPANCTFVFPAVLRKGPMTVAVSSGGACPVAAKMVRDKVVAALPDDFVAAVGRLGDERENLKRNYPDPQERRRICEEALKRWKD